MGFVYANLIGIFELRSAMNNSKNKLLIHTLVILGIMLPLQHAVSAELDFVKEGDAVYKPGHPELHVIQRSGWLRAAVLGANDGIISVTSLIMGMAASGASSQTLLVTCIAGLISGATSMAAGEYISVKSQEDIEKSDLKFEARIIKRQLS